MKRVGAKETKTKKNIQMAKERERGEGAALFDLPEGCIENVLWFTGPRDACRLSVVSWIFRSAAESDAVWERFLPPGYHSIISSSSDPSLSASSSSKKQLYLSLCDNPILIDNGKMSFSLDKWSGKTCYMLSARNLMIIWADTPEYWRWTSDPASRFEEVAELIDVCWLEIRGKINTCMLSPSTLYAAYLVFKVTTGAYGLESQPVEVTMGLVGTESCTRSVYLDAERGRGQQYRINTRRIGLLFNRRQRQYPKVRGDGWLERQYPKVRGDGWLEIELGEFFTKEGEDGELEMSVLEVNRGNWKRGLIVQGIEIRPKEGK